MHIEFARHRRTNLYLVGAVLLLLASVVTASAATQTDGDVPPDVSRLGVELVRPSDTTPKVDGVAAIAIGREIVPQLPATTPVDAYHLIATDSASLRTPQPMVDRPIWLLRFSGLELEFSAPYSADGEPKAHIAHFAYVFIDAETGQALDIQYWE